MSLISAHHLTKSYGADPILADVSVTMVRGQRVGLVGNNGSGKSTLARILAGRETADTGELMQERGSRVGYLAQVPALDETLTARDTVALGLSEWHKTKSEYDHVLERLARGDDEDELLSEQARLSAEVERLGGWDQEHRISYLLQHLQVPDENAQIGQLSGGEKRRVALAQLLLSEPDLLILDEPTNHLDTETADWLERYLLSQFKGALLLITHDRYFLDRLVERTLELHRGQLESYEGGWEAYLGAKAEREDQQARTESNRQNFLRREIEWLRRQPKARGTKQKARTQRAEDALGNTPAQSQKQMALGVVAKRQGGDILEFEALQLAIGGRTLVSQLDLIVGRGRRIGVIGRNGCGKTTLLRALMGQLEPKSGSIKLGKNTQLSYFDQQRSNLIDEQSIAENVAGQRSDRQIDTVTVGQQSLSIYTYLERFQFRGSEIKKPVSMLSGGERARVALAKLLLSETNLLLLDEPTNDLDVMTLSALEEMLLEFPGSALIVTHDRYFLNRVATDLLVFEGDGNVTHYVGNYDTYLALRPKPGAGSTKPTLDDGNAESAKPEPAARRTKRPSKLGYKESIELEGLMPRIEELEGEIADLEQRLSDPQLYKDDPTGAASLQEQLNSKNQELESTMTRWEELETKREAFNRSD